MFLSMGHVTLGSPIEPTRAALETFSRPASRFFPARVTGVRATSRSTREEWRDHGLCAHRRMRAACATCATRSISSVGIVSLKSRHGAMSAARGDEVDDTRTTPSDARERSRTKARAPKRGGAAWAPPVSSPRARRGRVVLAIYQVMISPLLELKVLPCGAGQNEAFASR